MKRFELEARAAALLNHPNIVSIHDVGLHRGIRFVVMELEEGRTLRDLLKSEPLPVSRAVSIAAQTAAALDAAHARGIVHGDLTPGRRPAGGSLRGRRR